MTVGSLSVFHFTVWLQKKIGLCLKLWQHRDQINVPDSEHQKICQSINYPSLAGMERSKQEPNTSSKAKGIHTQEKWKHNQFLNSNLNEKTKQTHRITQTKHLQQCCSLVSERYLHRSALLHFDARSN